MARKARAKRVRPPAKPPGKTGGKARKPANARTARPSPLAHCVFGPTNQVGDNLGVPDGGNDPTVVVEHRQTVILQPGADGRVAFALTSSPIGAIALGVCKTDLTVNTVDENNMLTASKPTHFEEEMYGWGSSNHNYGIVPFSEYIYNGSNLVHPDVLYANCGFGANEFRVITAQASVSYTGSIMTSSGTAATGRIAHDLDKSNFTDSSNYIRYTSEMSQAPPLSFNQVSNIPGARVFPAREPVTLLNPPSCFDWQPMRNSWTPSVMVDSATEDFSYAFYMLGADQKGTSTWLPSPGMGYAPCTYYYATGLDSTSSLTISARVCVEYKLSQLSPASRFARLPPPSLPKQISAVRTVSRSLPSSIVTTPEVEATGWLSVIQRLGNVAVPLLTGIGQSVLTGSPIPSILGLQRGFKALTM